MQALKTLARKRTLVASVLALTVFGAVYGFAATLNVSSNKLSAGNASVASCQATSPTATYTVGYDSTLGGYKVASVVVNGIGATCDNMPIAVSLTGAANASLAEITGNTGSAGSVTLTPSSTVDVKNVQGVAVAING